MANAEDFNPKGLKAGTPDSYSGGRDALTENLRKIGFDPSQPDRFQVPGLADQLKTYTYDAVSRLSELQRAQESGLSIDGLKEEFKNTKQEVKSLVEFLKSQLTQHGGVLPTYINKEGQRIEAPNAHRTIMQAATRGQGYLNSMDEAEKRAEDRRANLLKKEDRDADRLTRQIERQEAKEEKEKRGAYRAGLSDLRADTRVARIMADNGGLSPEMIQELKDSRTKLLSEIPDKLKEYDKAKADGNTTLRNVISQDLGATNNLAKEITNVLEHNNNVNKNSLNNVLKHIGNVVTTLGVASLAGRMFLSEPYQFGTRPALGVLGKQGEIGDLLSGAYGELEQYNLSLNQQTFGAGVGLLAGGLMKGGGVGTIMAAGGALIGGAGLLGKGDDVWRMLGGISEDDIISQSIVQGVADPQRLVNNFSSSRTGLMAAGGLSAGNFGYDYTGSRRSGETTGNSILDGMMELRGLGYNQESMGQLLSSTALNLRGNPDEMISYANQAGRISSAFGVSEDSVLANMQTAQRFGSQDAGRSVSMAIGAAADSEGNITSYTTNVLVPALMKVTESMALQNLSRSSVELEQEVYGLRTTIVNSESNLGKLMESNPEVLGRVVNTLQAAVGASLQNPAMLAYNLSTGSSFSDIYLKRNEVIDRNLGHVLNMPGMTGADFSDPNVFDTPMMQAALNAAMAITQITDIQMLRELLSIKQTEGTIIGEDGGLSISAAAVKSAKDEESSRTDAIIESKVGVLAANLATQTDELLITSQSMMDSFQKLQEAITGFINSDRIITLTEQAIADIIAKLDGILGNNTGASSNKIPVEVDGITISAESQSAVSSDGGTGVATGKAIGGYTGAGGSHQAAGIVHANEYVISSQNIPGNMELLDRIQSGEKISTPQKSGNVTYVTLKITGADSETIAKTAERAAETYIRRNRLNYV